MSNFPDFRAYCEKACIAYWGEPDRRTTKYLRWDGSSYDDYKLFYFQKRRWHDAAAKCGGSTLELAQYARGRPVETPRGPEFFEAWRYAYEQRWIPDPPPEKKLNGGGGDGKFPPIRRTYKYQDKDGALLYEVVRFDTEERDDRFRYRRPDGNGDWIWKLGRTKRVLYRLPELIKGLANKRPILICEGERDTETATQLGYVATTCSGGANKWRDEFDQEFAGADVVIVSDNDPPGQDHADNIAKHLIGVTSRLRKIVFPVKDLTEWVEAGHTREELDAIIEQAPCIKAPSTDSESDKGAGLEDSVALTFAEQHTDQFRYIAASSQWMRWTGSYWQIEHTLGAFDESRKLCRQAGDGRAKIVAAVVALARSDRRIAAIAEQWDLNSWAFNTGDDKHGRNL
jgi:hypothetical protein